MSTRGFRVPWFGRFGRAGAEKPNPPSRARANRRLEKGTPSLRCLLSSTTFDSPCAIVNGTADELRSESSQSKPWKATYV